MKRKRFWAICIGQICAHVLSGTGFFLVLCASALGMSLVLESIQQVVKVPAFTLLVLGGFEKTVVLVDAVFFSVYFAVIVVRALREILR